MISTVKPPFTLPVMKPLTISALVMRVLETGPRTGTLGLLAREARLAETVLERIECDFDFVAHGDFQLALLVIKLFGGYHPFRFEAGVDDDDVGPDFDYQGLEDGP